MRTTPTPSLPSKDSAEAYLGTEFMTEKLKVTDLITRLTYYPSLTISGRYRFSYRFDLDFNLPGDWYFRTGILRQLRQQATGGLFQERLRLVERASVSSSEPNGKTTTHRISRRKPAEQGFGPIKEVGDFPSASTATAVAGKAELTHAILDAGNAGSSLSVGTFVFQDGQRGA